MSFHHSPLRNPNIVPRRVLHQIHHLVGLPDDVVRIARIVRIRSQPDRSAHIQIQAFVAAKAAGAQRIAQPFGHHQRLIFARLRQQHHKFVAAIAEAKSINRSCAFTR